MSAKSVLVPLVCVVALVSATCSDDSSSPTAPSPTASTPPPAPAPTPTPTPSRGSIQISIVPSPVPFSGQPITNVSSCASSKNTWFYDQVFKESGGSQVTFTQRVDRFDGQTVNNLSGLSIVIPANGSLTISSRWCSTTAAEHSAESTFSGTDAAGNSITASGGIVRLMRP